MINFAYDLCYKLLKNPDSAHAAFLIASLNMLIQILFSAVFGADHVPKLRGKEDEHFSGCQSDCRSGC